LLQKSGSVSVSGGDEIIEMDRMHKLIAGYMVAGTNFSSRSNHLLKWM
jgi:2-oxoglutarate dehydrogenase E2 component (dihydrolipoamide succinyltransferase)